MTLIIAHRGASGYETENTLKAFHKAFEMQADGIELDLWPSADGEVFVHHDENLKRIYGQNALIHQTPSATLRQLGMPTLVDVLDMLPPAAIAFLEMKGAVEKPLAEMLRPQPERLAFLPVIGFNHAQLIRFKALLPEAVIGLTYDKNQLFAYHSSRWAAIMLKACATAKAEHVNIDHRLTTPELIHALHREGLKVNLWTVNHKSSLRALHQLPLYSVMSDYPDKARAVLHA